MNFTLSPSDPFILIFRYSLIIHALYRLRARTAILNQFGRAIVDSIVSSLRFSHCPFVFDTIFIVHRRADLVSIRVSTNIRAMQIAFICKALQDYMYTCTLATIVTRDPSCASFKPRSKLKDR